MTISPHTPNLRIVDPSFSMGLASSSSSLQKIPVEISLFEEDANYVKAPHVPETFLVSVHPTKPEQYWQAMIVSGAQIGVQLDQSQIDYHLLPGYTYSFAFGTIQLKKSEMLTSDCSLQRREYLLTDAEGKSRNFTHYSLNWPDYGTPHSDSFADLMLDYRKQIEILKSQQPASNSLSSDALETDSNAIKVHVHCRAGRGRSGTFLFARCLDCQPKNPLVASEPEELLEHIRSQRFGLVENPHQYLFACESVKGFELYGKMHFMQGQSLAGRLTWIRGDGSVEVMPLWKQLIVWIASLVHLKRWTIRHLTPFDDSMKGMLEMRRNVSNLVKVQPELAHRYWACWKLFSETFDIRAGEVEASKPESRKHTLPSLDLVLASRYLVDVQSLLEHYNEPTVIARMFLQHGMLGQALWIIQNRSVDMTALEDRVDIDVIMWVKMQQRLANNQPLSKQELIEKEYTDEDGNIQPGLGLGSRLAEMMLVAYENTGKWPRDYLVISDFEIRHYLQNMLPDNIAMSWGQFIAGYKILSAEIKQIEKAVSEKDMAAAFAISAKNTAAAFAVSPEDMEAAFALSAKDTAAALVVSAKDMEAFDTPAQDIAIFSKRVQYLLEFIYKTNCSATHEEWVHMTHIYAWVTSRPQYLSFKKACPIVPATFEKLTGIEMVRFFLLSLHREILSISMSHPYVSPLLEEYLSYCGHDKIAIHPCALQNADCKNIGMDDSELFVTSAVGSRVSQEIAHVIMSYFRPCNISDCMEKDAGLPAHLALSVQGLM